MSNEIVELDDSMAAGRYAKQAEVDNLQRQVEWLVKELEKLRRHAPKNSQRRGLIIRLGFEWLGVGIAATGAWWIYPPAALLLVGAWMLGDVLAARRIKRSGNA